MTTVLESLNKIRKGKGFSPLKANTNTNDLASLAGTFGLGALSMLNNTLAGGTGYLLGLGGRAVEAVSPLSGETISDNDREILKSIGYSDYDINQRFPREDSWLTSAAKGALEARNYVDKNLDELNKATVGDNPTLAANIAHGAGTSLGFMLSALLLGSTPLQKAAAMGGTEALSETGSFLGDAYKNGQYDNGALGTATKNFAANAALNTGLNYFFAPFGTIAKKVPNPYLRYIAGSGLEVGNELLQEPSQQVIEQASTNSLNNGTGFLSELGESAKQWPEMLAQLAPEVTGSTLLTQALLAPLGIRANINYNNYLRNDIIGNKSLEELQAERVKLQELQKDNIPDIAAQEIRGRLPLIDNAIGWYPYLTKNNPVVGNNNTAVADTTQNIAPVTNDEELKKLQSDLSTVEGQISNYQSGNLESLYSLVLHRNNLMAAINNYGKDAETIQSERQAENAVVQDNGNQLGLFDGSAKPPAPKVKVPPKRLENISDAPELLTENTPSEQTEAPQNRNITTVRTLKGTEVDVRYRVVDADDLITSNISLGSPNPKYPQELQPRNRNSAASFQQIDKIAQTLDPTLLAESRLASDGAPVVGPDMVVESGNGRTMAVRKAYEYNSAEGYRNWIIDNAGRFGINPDYVRSLNKPILVRERISEVDRLKFTSEANESSIATMSTTEHAMEDAKRITPVMLRTYDMDKPFEGNKRFISLVIWSMPQNEQGDLIQKNGTPSKSGVERVKYALAAMAYKDTSILSRLSEITDDESKNVSNALIQAAPQLAIMERSGIRPELSIGNDIMKAVNILATLKENEQKVAEYLVTGKMFEDDGVSDEALKLLKFFDDNKRSSRRITNGLTYYAESVMNEARQGQSVMFEDSVRTKGQILDEAIRVVTEEAEAANTASNIDTNGQDSNIFSQNNTEYSPEQAKQDIYKKLRRIGRSEEEARAIAELFVAGKKFFAKYSGRDFKDIVESVKFVYQDEITDKKDRQVKARTEFHNDVNAIIRISKLADKSSILHELGHVFLKDFQNLAKSGLLKGLAKQDWNTLLKSYGLTEIDFNNMSDEDRSAWYEAHEKFATDFERYLMTGESPNAKLKHVFEAFKRWLTEIYGAIQKIKYIGSDNNPHSLELSDNIKKVMADILSEGDNEAEGEGHNQGQFNIDFSSDENDKQSSSWLNRNLEKAFPEIAKSLKKGLSFTPSDVMPNFLRTDADKQGRIKRQAEVVTPLKTVKGMADTTDRQLRENYKDWKRYVKATVLEPACGESPFVVTRYAPETGRELQIDKRVGLLDRKLQEISNNATSQKEWLRWAFEAFNSVYGFDIDGGNVLVARTNLINTFADYLQDKWHRKPTKQELETLSDIVTHNYFQDDYQEAYRKLDKMEAREVNLSFLNHVPAENLQQPGVKSDTVTPQNKPKNRGSSWQYSLFNSNENYNQSVNDSDNNFITPEDIELFNQSAYHGTRHELENNRFNLKKIGSGEGAQVYGWGIYLAENRAVAEYYRNAGRSYQDSNLHFVTKDGQTHNLDVKQGHYPNYISNPNHSTEYSPIPSVTEDLAIKLMDFPNATLEELKEKVRSHYENGLEEARIKIAEFKKQRRNIKDKTGWEYRKVKRDLDAYQIYVNEFSDRKKALDEIISMTFDDVKNGNLYKFEGVPENEDLLDWDSPFEEQPKNVQEALKKIASILDNSEGDSILSNEDDDDSVATGEIIYQNIVNVLSDWTDRRNGPIPISFLGNKKLNNSQQAASMLLNKFGVPGLRYLDQGSRATQEGTHNFVIWNTNTLKAIGISSDSDKEAKEYFKRGGENQYKMFEDEKLEIFNQAAQRTSTPRHENVTNFNSLIDLAKKSEGEFHKKMRELQNELGGELKERSTMKREARIREKVHMDYKDDFSRCVDVWGGSLIFDNEKDLLKALKKLDARDDVVRLKDKWNNPDDSGYRDINANIMLSNGFVVELQLHHKGIMYVKDEGFGIGHLLYDFTRNPKYKYNTEMKGLISKVNEISKKIYEAGVDGNIYDIDANSKALFLDIGKRLKDENLSAAEANSLVKDLSELTRKTLPPFSSEAIISGASSRNSIANGTSSPFSKYRNIKKTSNNINADSIANNEREDNKEVYNQTENDYFDTLQQGATEKTSQNSKPNSSNGLLFDPNNSEVYNQIIGEKGARELDKAEDTTNRMDNLEVAKEMEKAGKDAKIIRLATGWEKGHDGKWRWEILDNFIDTEKLEELKENRKKYNFRSKKEQPSYHAKLGELIKDKTLLRALEESYGDLPTVSITAEPFFDSAYDLFRRSIDLSIHSGTDVLLHEIQHFIQDKEGFAQGGDHRSAKDFIDSNPEIAKKLEQITLLEKEAKGKAGEPLRLAKAFRKLEKSLGFQDSSKKMSQEEEEKYREHILEVQKENPEAIEQLKEILRKKSEAMTDAKHRIKELRESIPTTEEVYYSFSGEVEARNVQKRYDFTEEQRRNTTLAETEDVARDKQIEIFNQAAYNPRGFFSRLFKRIADNLHGRDIEERAMGVSSSPALQEDTSFENKESEQRYRVATKGIKKAGVLARVKHAVFSMGKSISTAYPEFSGNKDLLPAQVEFEKLERAKRLASKEAMKSINDNLKDLSDYDFDLFVRKRLLDNLNWFKEQNPDAELPFGFDDNMLKREHQRFTTLAEQRPAVMKAIQNEERRIANTTREFTMLAKNLGMNFDNVFKNPHYYHHSVLQYATTAAAGRNSQIAPTPQNTSSLQQAIDTRLNEIRNRNFMKKRKGSTLDINMNYFQAMGEVEAQMRMDNETMKTLIAIKQKYDKAPELRAALKQAFNKAQKSGQESYSQGEGFNLSDIIPEGYTLYNPAGSRLIQSANTATENVLAMALDDASEETGLPLDEIINSMGANNDEILNQLWVIPTQIKEHLKRMSRGRDRGMLGKTAKSLTTLWKRAVLFSPTRNLKYNFRNFTGDLDAVIAGNPSALKYFGRAVKELTAHYRGKGTTKDLQDFIQQSGGLNIESFSMSDSELRNLERLLEQNRENKTLPKKAWGLIKTLWSREKTFTEWRENILRYAAYLDYLQQMNENKGTPSSWGASNKDEVMALSDLKERAFKMSNELLGDYDNISEAGKQLREFAVPFYSWWEVNAKRYYRILRNGIKGDNGSNFAKRVLLGQAANVPYYAMTTAETVAKIALLSMVVQMFNRMVFGDDDDELPEAVKFRPHLTLGKHNGKVYYFDRIGALADVADWISLDSVFLDTKEIMNGQQTLGGYLQKMAKAPVSKAISGLNPIIKMPFELTTKRSTYPDAFNSRTIRDRGEYVAQTLGLSWPYKAIAGTPRSDADEFTKLLLYSVDPDEAAYYQTLDKVRQFKERVLDKHFDGIATTKRGEILRKLKQAMRYKDRAAVSRYLQEYKKLDGTKQGLKQSMKAMDPLFGLNAKEKAQFLKWIKEDDRKYLRRANKYFHELADKYTK